MSEVEYPTPLPTPASTPGDTTTNMSKEGKVPLPVPRFHVDPLVGQFGKAERAFEALVCSLEDFRVLLQKAYNVLAHYGVKYFTDKWDQVADGDRCIDDIVAVFTGSTACMTTNFLEELDRAREAWTAGRRIFVVCVGLMPVTDKKTKKLQELTNGTAVSGGLLAPKVCFS